MKAAALRGALSDRARNGRIHAVAGVGNGEAPSTKAARQLFAGISERKNLLVVLARGDERAFLSVRNLPKVHVLNVDQLNTYDVMCADDVVFTEEALRSFIEARGPLAGAAGTPVFEEEAK